MKHLAILAPLALAGCGDRKPEPALSSAPRTVVASVYWQPQRVACGGGRFAPHGITFAHKRLPCGTRARFTAASGASVVSTLNDRGPYVAGREIDLSDGTARAIGLGRSVHRVKMEIIK